MASNNINLRDFLKKFTAVPEKFIDEYWEFYELCENELFGIPVDKVMKYLSITDRKKFIERLRSNYVLGKDFQVTRLTQKSQKGIKDVIYMLSFECFERICLMSNTKKGQEYRDYFIMLRKFIDYYKQHITDKIENLTKTHKYIYIMLVNKNKNIFKLGRTGNIRKRLQSYSTGKDTHPDIKFIMIVEDDKQVENCAKIFAKSKQFKANKELYRENLDDLKKIVNECAILSKNSAEMLNNNDNSGKYDKYVVFDDSKSIEYLNLDGDIIGWSKKIPTHTQKNGGKKLKRDNNKTRKN
jgi:hypothetical protein